MNGVINGVIAHGLTFFLSPDRFRVSLLAWPDSPGSNIQARFTM